MTGPATRPPLAHIRPHGAGAQRERVSPRYSIDLRRKFAHGAACPTGFPPPQRHRCVVSACARPKTGILGVQLIPIRNETYARSRPCRSDESRGRTGGVREPQPQIPEAGADLVVWKPPSRRTRSSPARGERPRRRSRVWLGDPEIAATDPSCGAVASSRSAHPVLRFFAGSCRLGGLRSTWHLRAVRCRRWNAGLRRVATH